jgi:hypothetical protein
MAPSAPVFRRGVVLIVLPGCAWVLGADFDGARERDDEPTGEVPTGDGPKVTVESGDLVEGAAPDVVDANVVESGALLDDGDPFDASHAPDALGDAGLDATVDAKLDVIPDGTVDATLDVIPDGPVDAVDPPDALPAAAQGSAIALAARSNFTCAVTQTGRVACWGTGPAVPRGGHPVAAGGRGLPAFVAGIDGAATAVCAGDGHACALASGRVLCWGHGGVGQLGGEVRAVDHVAKVVPGLEPVRSIACGASASCAITAAGALLCWGDVGGRFPVRTDPAIVEGFSSGVTAVSLGRSISCALKGETIECFGPDVTNGQYGTFTRTRTLLDADARLVGGGEGTGFGVSDRLYGWGQNRYGQITSWQYQAGKPIGQGSSFVIQPTEIGARLSQIAQVVAGRGHVCARSSTGSVACWGANDHGQLGWPTTNPDGIGPGQPESLPLVVEIAAGVEHTCARTESGAVYCWGLATSGQLGVPTITTSTAHVTRVPGF